MQLHYRLAFDEAGFPLMYVFSTCKAFIRTLPLLRYDTQKCEDLDTDGEDHAADEARYFCMARPVKPPVAAGVDNYSLSPFALYLDIGREAIKTVTKRPGMEIINDG